MTWLKVQIMRDWDGWKSATYGSIFSVPRRGYRGGRIEGLEEVGLVGRQASTGGPGPLYARGLRVKAGGVYVYLLDGGEEAFEGGGEDGKGSDGRPRPSSEEEANYCQSGNE